MRTPDHSGKVDALDPSAHHGITQGDEIVQPHIGGELNEERPNAKDRVFAKAIYVGQP